MLELIFSFKLDWGSSIISIAKTASKKIGALIRSMKFLFFEVALYLYKSYHLSTYGILLSRLDWSPWLLLRSVRQAAKTYMQDGCAPLAHHQNVLSLSLFYKYYFGRCSS